MAAFTFTDINKFESVTINPKYLACVEEHRVYDKYQDKIIRQDTKIVMCNGREYLVDGDKREELKKMMFYCSSNESNDNAE